MTYQAKAAQYKKKQVEEFTELMKEYPVVGVVNVENLPSRQFQILRKKLRKDALLIMGKVQFIKMAIDNVKASKKDFEKIADSIEGMPALLFTKQNPFKISSIIRASKSKAPAKPGQLAPYDLIIPAGPTPFTPGPIISELSSVGLKTGVENGKVTIRADSTIVSKGEEVSKKASEILAKFGIEPMQIGLDLVAAYEDGVVYLREILSIDAEQFISMLKTAAAEALGLSIEVGYTTKGNIERFIGKAHNIAKNFAANQKITVEASPEESKEPEKKEQPEPEQKEEGKTPGVVASSGKISEDFKKEISDEKKRRESIDQKAAEELVNELKKKGTLRQ